MLRSWIRASVVYPQCFLSVSCILRMKVCTFFRDGLICSLPSYLRTFCPRKFEPWSSIRVIAGDNEVIGIPDEINFRPDIISVAPVSDRNNGSCSSFNAIYNHVGRDASLLCTSACWKECTVIHKLRSCHLLRVILSIGICSTIQLWLIPQNRLWYPLQ